jgi:hypothetical protein
MNFQWEMNMEVLLSQETYLGPEIDDIEIFDQLPLKLQNLLSKKNGYISFSGGFHLFGSCFAPEWHSIRHHWVGTLALSNLFPYVRPTDIPFAESAIGEQFLLRDDQVHFLLAEKGSVKPLDVDLDQFLKNVKADPVDYLYLYPLLKYLESGKELLPGQLLHTYPPLTMSQNLSEITVSAVPYDQKIHAYAQFAEFYNKNFENRKAKKRKGFMKVFARKKTH